MTNSKIFFQHFPPGPHFSWRWSGRTESGGPPKSLMCRENIGVNVKRNLWKVSPTPKAHRRHTATLASLGCQDKQAHIGGGTSTNTPRTREPPGTYWSTPALTGRGYNKTRARSRRGLSSCNVVVWDLDGGGRDLSEG